jgi:hypothetical protein
MKRPFILVFVAAVALYLPTVRYGYVQDDRAIIVANPAAHSVAAAIRGFAQPYWPRESGAGLYRPITILSYAVDWSLSGGRAGWLHFMNALWHGLAAVLLMAVVMRWLPPLAAIGAGLLFAWHPVHVEAVASLVGRAELLAAVGILGGVLAARRGWWIGAVLCAAVAMLSKEHGVIAGVVILLDRWLQGPEARRYPLGLWIGLGAVTAGFVAAWLVIGSVGTSDAAAALYGRGVVDRLAVALPAVLQAAVLLVWPLSLSSDYNPQVLPARDGFSAAAALGALLVVAIPMLVFWCRRRAPAVAFAAGLSALSFLPTANLLFASGVVLAERNLYLAVALPAALVATGLAWLQARRLAAVALTVVALACGARSFDRLPAWRDNRSQLLTLLAEHPESYRAHASAAAVLAGMGDTAGARREYRTADSLFSGDPYLDAAHAIYLLGLGDTTTAARLVARSRTNGGGPAERMALRAQFLLELARGNPAGASAVVDSARRLYPGDETWYLRYRQ